MTRIVAWNAQQAVAAKTGQLLTLEPDIAVIAECATGVGAIGAMHRVCWAGTIPAKGLAVFARPELGGRLDASHDPGHEHYLPVRFDAIDLGLLAVWAMHYGGTDGSVGFGRTHDALAAYAPFLATADLVVGDFNDSPVFDGPSRHHWARTAEILDGDGYVSLYHERTGEQPGAETAPTLYHLRHEKRPFHIDHAFLRRDRLPAVAAYAVGDADPWLSHSDHMPLVLDLDLPAPAPDPA